MSSRPELVAPPEIFYDDAEARKYTSSSRIIEIQAKLSERALELLALPDDGVPRLLLDIGVQKWECSHSSVVAPGVSGAEKQLSGDVEACASSTFELQRKLVQSSLATDSSGGLKSSFSFITPSSAVFQVIIGGGGSSFGGGSGATAGAPAGGALATEAPPAEEKKEEKEESDDDLGFSLFD